MKISVFLFFIFCHMILAQLPINLNLPIISGPQKPPVVSDPSTELPIYNTYNVYIPVDGYITEESAYVSGYGDCAKMMRDSSKSVNEFKKALQNRKYTPYGQKPLLLNKWHQAFYDCLVDYQKALNGLPYFRTVEYDQLVVNKPGLRPFDPYTLQKAEEAYLKGYKDGHAVIKECTLSVDNFKKTFPELASNPFRSYQGVTTDYNAKEYITGFQEAWEKYQYAFDLKLGLVSDPRKDRTNPGSAYDSSAKKISEDYAKDFNEKGYKGFTLVGPGSEFDG